MTLILNLTLWAALLAFGIIILRTISRDIGPKEISPWAASGISAGFALTLFLALNDGSNGWPGYLILSLLA
ncbi:MAG: hypothetical protein JNM52_03290, partial [Betaproteobacteria bacterium]|nr:hypothetical protein [Betaproteobacteria bacterium]